VQESGQQDKVLHSEQPFLDDKIRAKLIREKITPGLSDFVIMKDYKVIRWILKAIFKNGDSMDVAGRAIPRPQWPSNSEDQERIKTAAEVGTSFVNNLSGLVRMVFLLIDPSSESLLAQWAYE
jgi:hypothetical protein